MQVFLGFANFYPRFIYGHSAIAAPLTGLLKGSKDGKKFGSFQWSESAEEAPVQLRRTFSKAPFLRHYDPKKKLRVEIDAFNFGFGVVLTQQDEHGH